MAEQTVINKIKEVFKHLRYKYNLNDADAEKLADALESGSGGSGGSDGGDSSTTEEVTYTFINDAVVSGTIIDSAHEVHGFRNNTTEITLHTGPAFCTFQTYEEVKFPWIQCNFEESGTEMVRALVVEGYETALMFINLIKRSDEEIQEGQTNVIWVYNEE